MDELDVAVAVAAARARTEALTGRPDGVVVHHIEWVPPGTPPRHRRGFHERTWLDRSLPYLVVLAPSAVIAGVFALVVR